MFWVYFIAVWYQLNRVIFGLGNTRILLVLMLLSSDAGYCMLRFQQLIMRTTT
jgi:hypothetical protein